MSVTGNPEPVTRDLVAAYKGQDQAAHAFRRAKATAIATPVTCIVREVWTVSGFTCCSPVTSFVECATASGPRSRTRMGWPCPMGARWRLLPTRSFCTALAASVFSAGTSGAASSPCQRILDALDRRFIYASEPAVNGLTIRDPLRQHAEEQSR